MTRVHQFKDNEPGALPDIRPSGDGVTYVMTPHLTWPGKALVIRCDGSGEAWISIRPAEHGVFGLATTSARRV